MDFLAHVAEFACEQHLHLRVYVLHVILNDKVAILASMIYILQFGEQLYKFILFEQAY